MSNLRFPFNHMPRCLLLVCMFLVFPVHIAIGVLGGLHEGCVNWRYEFIGIWNMGASDE